MGRSSSDRVSFPDVIRRWPTEKARRWVSSFVKDARQNPRIVAVVAVGSAVRDDVPSADIDLVVICSELTDCSPKAPIEVDLRAYAVDEIEEKVESGHDFLGWALKFGIPVVQKNHFWDRLRSRFAGKIPLPSSAIARRRAARSDSNARELLRLGDQDAAREEFLSSLTHLARAKLIEHGVYPTSRPELPCQLREAGHYTLAGSLEDALNGTTPIAEILSRFPGEHRLTKG